MSERWVHVLEAGQKMTGTVRDTATGKSEPFTVTFSDDDLDWLASSYDPVGKTRGVLGVDHRREGPQYGDFSELEKRGTALFARLDNLFPVAEEAIATKAYRSLSSNIDLDYNGSGKPYFLGADLLGAKIPAMAGGAPIQLGASARVASFETGVQQVEIVYPGDDYKPGDLKNALLEETARDRANTVIDKARQLADNVWWSTKKAADKIAAVMQIFSDAAPLVADTTIVPDPEECDMNAEQMASFAKSVATELVAELKSRDEALVASFAASLKTASVEVATDADLDARATAFAAERLAPAASPARRLALAASYKACVAADADLAEDQKATGAVAELTAMFAKPTPPPTGEAAPTTQHASVEAKKFVLTLADGSTKRVELSATATPEHQAHVAAAVEYANQNGVDFSDAMIVTAPGAVATS